MTRKRSRRNEGFKGIKKTLVFALMLLMVFGSTLGAFANNGNSGNDPVLNTAYKFKIEENNFKVGDSYSGSNGLIIKITNLVSKPDEPGEYMTISWESNQPISHIYLKASNGGEQTDYNPAATSGTVTVPDKFAISHISFYYNEPTVVEIQPAPQTGSIKIIKTIDHVEGDFQAGVTFNLKKDGQVIDTKVTDADGAIVFGELQPGDYTIEEIIPRGYSTEHNFNQIITVVAGDQEVVQVVNQYEGEEESEEPAEPEKTTGAIRIVKTIGSVEGERQAGVTFKLKQGNVVIKEDVTNDDGILDFEELQPGNYTIEEVLPEGYTTEHDFSEIITVVADDVKTVEVVNQLIENPRDEAPEAGPGSIKVIKTIGTESGTPQAGVTFKLKQGNEERASQVTNADGIVIFAELTAGEYTLEEIVPAGYRTNLDSTRIITVEAGKETEVKVINSVIVNVQLQPQPQPQPPTPQPTPTPTNNPTETEIIVEENPIPLDSSVVVEVPQTPAQTIEETELEGENTPQGVLTTTGEETDLPVEENVPLGVLKLPKTGEESNLILYLVGLAFVVMGLFIRRFKNTRTE